MKSSSGIQIFATVMLLAGLIAGGINPLNAQQSSFNKDWQVKILDKAEINPAMFIAGNSAADIWENVCLPHTLKIEPVFTDQKQWQGFAAYRKFFTLQSNSRNKLVYLSFEGAMHTAKVYLDGKLLMTHYGGYLPFTVDLTPFVSPNRLYCVLVLLDNTDAPQVPPGKPLADLDFNYYSGIYRNVQLQLLDKLHFTDVNLSNRIGGGGVTTHVDVNESGANVAVWAEAKNEMDGPASPLITAELYDQTGKLLAENTSSAEIMASNQVLVFSTNLHLDAPILWTPDQPYLYRLKVSIMNNAVSADSRNLLIGIKNIRFTADSGFILNGKECKIRGTNRHQEYPFIGNALSDNDQYRDAYKIKQAGFNFVRSCHYPQSPAFLDACDQLGIMVMNSIPGWQFFGDSLFQERSIQDVRNMIHRDRNHVSIILWEASLNESAMSGEYMKRAHETVHRELPYNDTYTCGWLDTIYDVFIPARQHAKPPHYWNDYSRNKPLLIAEYGDWEYYAQNAGFNQKEYANLKEEERTSRQLRGAGQKRLQQQALNYQESHNHNLLGKSVGDANWLMFDYKRGYAPDIESSGIMDIFRLPKFAFYFYRSQQLDRQKSGLVQPMVYIADYWNDSLTKRIKVYSNCEEVELLLNGKVLAKKGPDKGADAVNLEHPPFTFSIDRFMPGTLSAVGFIAGKEVASDSRITPGKANSLKIEVDYSGKPLQSEIKDHVFIYARLTDDKGSLVPVNNGSVKFIVEGDATLIGENPARVEAGIATIILEAGNKKGIVKIKTEAEGLIPSVTELIIR
ncbi:MAG: DUF4982 domain-containing protein [Bacteroidales bacterium]|nr:DUF4982 domain-containing protein [Bacteroidales bacterium]